MPDVAFRVQHQLRRAVGRLRRVYFNRKKTFSSTEIPIFLCKEKAFEDEPGDLPVDTIAAKPCRKYPSNMPKYPQSLAQIPLISVKIRTQIPPLLPRWEIALRTSQSLLRLISVPPSENVYKHGCFSR